MRRSSAGEGRGEGQRGDRHREDRLIESRLAEALQQAGWEVSGLEESARGGGQPDLVARKGEFAYAVELKFSAVGARRSVLEGALADAMLRSRLAAEQSGLEPLAVVCAPSLSDSMVGHLESYAAEFGCGSAWGVMDQRGRLMLRGEGLESVPESRPRPAERQRARKSSHWNVFSDLGQWMLKVLLAEEIPVSWLNAPRAGVGVASISALAERADVSIASASKFMSAMMARGFAEQEGGQIDVVLRDQLMRAWSSAGRGPFNELPARLVLRSNDPLPRLKSELARLHAERRNRVAHDEGSAGLRSRACLGLFAACDELGFGMVRGVPPYIYIEGFDLALLEELGLEFVDRGESADVIVRKPKFPESLFRGCVNVDGVPVADVLQCWLDVWSYPARGYEQVSAIRERLVEHGVFE